jgi:hypothetical protein
MCRIFDVRSVMVYYNKIYAMKALDVLVYYDLCMLVHVHIHL